MMIDVDNGHMKVKVQDEEVSFNIFETIKHYKDKGFCFQLDAIEEAIKDVEKQLHDPSPLRQALIGTQKMLGEKEEQEFKERLKELDTLMEIPLEEPQNRKNKNKNQYQIIINRN